MNNIELSTVYLPLLDKVYKQASKTSILEGDEATMKRGDNGELKVAKLDMDALGDFDRNSGYTKGSTTFRWETIKYDKELEDFLMSTYTSSSIDAVIQKSCLDNSFFDVFISLGSNDDYVKTSKSNLHVLDELKRMKMSLETIKEGKQWLLLNYPSVVDSNNLGMSYEDYYRYAMDAMTYDFSNMLDSIENLRVMMNKSNIIRIVGDNVNLSFNKTGIPAVPLLGNVNLPDGEIYTSPIKTSANGYIMFNVPSPKNGLIF